MEMQGIPVIMANLSIHRQREEANKGFQEKLCQILKIPKTHSFRVSPRNSKSKLKREREGLQK
ncbi:hypothetical protein PIB30_105566, partial [Stylosanthes scabra]|nr:hypothetical protein [Stylosanthes scabra]